MQVPQYQAHRGYCKMGEVENTLASIGAAVSQGAEMVEIDVCLTKDHVPVLLHDPDLKRLFDSEQLVHLLTAEELALHGSIDTLAEAMDEFPDMKFNIELKLHKGVTAKHLVRAVAEVLRSRAHSEKCLISSFRPECVRQMASELPTVTRAFLVGRESGIPQWLLLPVFLWSKAEWLHLQDDMIDAGVVRTWQKRGVPLAAWTVNAAVRAEELLAFGVKSIISDQLPLHL